MPIDFQSLTGDGRFNGFGLNGVGGFRAGLLAWPVWARYALMVPMIPGILLLALSIGMIFVSVLALFVLTAPVYLLLARVFDGRKKAESYRSPGSKRVEAVIRDA